MTTPANFEALFYKADAAGMAAGEAATPTPMVVGSPSSLFGNDVALSKPTYFVADGVCGFALVKIKGNSAFGRWAKKAGKARPDYPSGLAISAAGRFNQSMQRKEAWANAFANVLSEHGIDAYAQSRMD